MGEKWEKNDRCSLYLCDSLGLFYYFVLKSSASLIVFCFLRSEMSESLLSNLKFPLKRGPSKSLVYMFHFLCYVPFSSRKQTSLNEKIIYNYSE